MENNEFKPYIPAEKITPEFTVTSCVLGIILAVVFGAANAYLGLRVGTTVSASIPAAVISMAVIRVILKKDSILENNMVQTIGSAGESLAAGSIFTMPALFLWAKEGIMDAPDLIEIAIIALCGGILGVCFMVPLRNALIVKEHGILPYPEGTACAEVLLAGEKGGTQAAPVFVGMGVAAVLKFLVDGLGVAAGTVTLKIEALKTELSTEVYPALVGVGYIIGFRIASNMFAGGILAWFVLIPAIIAFGKDTILFPGTTTIAEIYASSGATGIWSNYIRYIGAGAVAAGGVISLIRTFPIIIRTFIGAIKGISVSDTSSKRTEQDISIKMVGICILAIILVITFLPQIPVTLPGAVIIVIFGFFFATVSARMVGLVGATNNPVSGMAIATLLLATVILKVSGDTGAHGMKGAIVIGSIICIIAAMSGDMSQDMKTGYILGATPKKQQIGEIVGTLASAISIGFVLVLLDQAWGFGSAELAAPQATLMKLIVEGVMGGNLPWSLVFLGVFISVALEILGIRSLSVAIGLYLPLKLSATIMLGGLTRLVLDKMDRRAGKEEKNNDAGSGILFCSGMIAGEGLVGILLAVFAILGIDKAINISSVFTTGQIGGLVLIILMIGLVVFYARKKNE